MLRTCPGCGRQTQPRSKKADRQYIAGVLRTQHADGRCLSCAKFDKDGKPRMQESRTPVQVARDNVRLHNTISGLDAFLTARRRRRVPAEGWRVSESS